MEELGEEKNMSILNFDECSECGIDENLTKHHVKDIYGIKTGEIQILCRSCHDEVEKKYAYEGRLGKKRLPKNKPIQKNRDWRFTWRIYSR